jgi:hypothetical protein
MKEKSSDITGIRSSDLMRARTVHYHLFLCEPYNTNDNKLHICLSFEMLGCLRRKYKK